MRVFLRQSSPNLLQDSARNLRGPALTTRIPHACARYMSGRGPGCRTRDEKAFPPGSGHLFRMPISLSETAVPASVPAHIRLQIVSPSARPPDGDGWLHEIKHPRRLVDNSGRRGADDMTGKLWPLPS